jgi:hypothetical protein
VLVEIHLPPEPDELDQAELCITCWAAPPEHNGSHCTKACKDIASAAAALAEEGT